MYFKFQLGYKKDKYYTAVRGYLQSTILNTKIIWLKEYIIYCV